MNLTEDQVWHAVFEAQSFFLDRHLKPYTNHDVADRVVKNLFGKSFSAIVAENNEIHQTCDMGHKHVLHPYTWRPLFIPTLELMRELDRPITTPELMRKFPDDKAAGKVLSELVNFGAVYKIGSGYRLTKLGDEFLDGTSPLPEACYKQGVRLPENAPSFPMKYIDR